jgi:hypothetical protein
MNRTAEIDPPPVTYQYSQPAHISAACLPQPFSASIFKHNLHHAFSAFQSCSSRFGCVGKRPFPDVCRRVRNSMPKYYRNNSRLTTELDGIHLDPPLRRIEQESIMSFSPSQWPTTRRTSNPRSPCPPFDRSSPEPKS